MMYQVTFELKSFYENETNNMVGLIGKGQLFLSIDNLLYDKYKDTSNIELSKYSSISRN